MPVRSLSSSVLKWPERDAVIAALRDWAGRSARERPGVTRIGYAGSYARGDWGVGSDLDLIVIVRESQHPFERRAVEWDATELPVPVDVLVYTQAEWDALERGGRSLARETVWVTEPQVAA